ncbi:hypothetical protein ADICYQ_3168 [Cyclobacterium qasimii M12-11B]|uniref:Uncharacterized protein n=1 Tax=Cyclobacterium qasimii M12-11B TaxID=641524 RepID=S7VDY9_9BACT|nr:hypothetical protein ADICYQ_3168 [Cyclobacterium qasimii M12-11B]
MYFGKDFSNGHQEIKFNVIGVINFDPRDPMTALSCGGIDL